MSNAIATNPVSPNGEKFQNGSSISPLPETLANGHSNGAKPEFLNANLPINQPRKLKIIQIGAG
jgi:hypothetical protein